MQQKHNTYIFCWLHWRTRRLVTSQRQRPAYAILHHPFAFSSRQAEEALLLSDFYLLLLAGFSDFYGKFTIRRYHIFITIAIVLLPSYHLVL